MCLPAALATSADENLFFGREAALSVLAIEVEEALLLVLM